MSTYKLSEKGKLKWDDAVETLYRVNNMRLERGLKPIVPNGQSIKKIREAIELAKIDLG